MVKEEPNLCIIIPAFNAADTLPAVLAEVCDHGLPILVVDDGSTDETGETANEAALAVLSHPENRGKGAALKTGFAEASNRGFTHALTLDADGQHPANLIPVFVEACREFPRAILVGNRFGEGSTDEMPKIRHISNSISSKLISMAARKTIPDAQCGMRIYPLDTALSFNLESDGYAMESEVLVKAGRRGIQVLNIPISCHYPDGTATSRYRAIVDSARIARAVLRSLRKGEDPNQ